MSADPNGEHTLLLERMVTQLKAHATAQATIDPRVGFRVYSGHYRAAQAIKVPTVSAYFAGMRSARETARASAWEVDATYHLDMIAAGKATQAGARGDEQAYARLMYLIQQVLNGIYNVDARSAIEDGDTEIGWPNVEVIDPAEYAQETPLVGARLTISARFDYVPAPTIGAALDAIHVDADIWSGLYEYGED